ncbi:MAG: group II intron reverse transcriptase domain-containing protein [Verrucomicrobiales bacterium]|nr:group II intron reverse transcriptase domain-containing protein [Verrucomicrobiales bacterium]MCP5557971.1 group II intron reverse transcriptase domain-containing protein [Verrucomicrobiaceae bacterium]
MTLEAIAAPENLLLAAAKARRGKSRRPDVEDWWQRRETQVLRLSDELASGTWRPAGYRFFEIHEPKRRMIAAAPFADRVVHHALCNVMQPALERRFIARSFSCQVGKGTTAARECCRKLVNQHSYVLKCDVRRFFPSLDHEVLMRKLASVIRCAAVLRLCRVIVDSHHTADRPNRCGLPIGNLTSQIWGNFYLDALDHQITEAEEHGAYLRYTDDFLTFSNDKRRLWELREVISTSLEAVHLELHTPKTRILQSTEGVPFCGFRFLPGLRPRVLGPTKRRFRHRTNLLCKQGAPSAIVTAATFAWYQFSREGNTHGLRKAWAINRTPKISIGTGKCEA